MILRSQLRMNKNIVFPFISCIMIMLTLLVLIHKSADELSAAKKEIAVCKQQHDSLYTQLQSAIEYKLRLEKSLQNEKTDTKQKIEEMQALLVQEKEDRKKEKEEEDNRYEALNQRFAIKETENKDFNDENDKLRKKIVDKDEEMKKLSAKLIAACSEKDQLLISRNKIIEDLQEKFKKYESAGSPSKKITPETNNGILQQGEPIQTNLNSSTPDVDPLAIAAGEEKQLMPPPPPPAQQPKEEPENALQKQMRKDLNLRQLEVKPEENVIKAPENKGEKRMDFENNELDGDNKPAMFIPKPDMGQGNKILQQSSASNVADAPRDDQQQVLPLPNQNAEKIKEIPRQIKDYLNNDYGAKDFAGEEEGEEAEYAEDNGKAPPPPKKAGPKQEENLNNGESVVVQPK